jgi:hypothetical protein
MPVVHVPVSLAGGAAESTLQKVKGLLEKIQVKVNGLSGLTIRMKEYQVKSNGDGSQVSFDVAERSGINADVPRWIPLAPTTLPDGSEGTGEAHQPVRSGWTIEVEGAGTGVVDVWVTFDQG